MSNRRHQPQPFGRLMTIHMVVSRVVRIGSSLDDVYTFRVRERRAEKGRYYMPWPHVQGDPFFERDLVDGLTYGIPLIDSPSWSDGKQDEIRFRRMHWGGIGLVVGNVMKQEGLVTPERSYGYEDGSDPGYMNVAATHRMVELACPPSFGAAVIVLAMPYDLSPYPTTVNPAPMLTPVA